MKQIIYKYADGVEVLVDIDEEEFEEEYELLAAGTEKAGALARIPSKEIAEKFKDLLKKNIDKILMALKDNFDRLNEKLGTSSAQVEFSISVKGEKNLVISKFAGEAQFKITLTWDYSDKKV